MRTAVYALYADPRDAQRAFQILSSASSELSFDRRQIVVVSDEPLDWSLGTSLETSGELSPAKKPPEGHLEPHDSAHEHAIMYKLAVLGGILGGAFGWWLTAFTQKAYIIPTGGMPIVTPWTNAIIIYETTMLGAILFNLGTMLIRLRLPSFKKRLSDPEIWTGKILVGVADPPDSSRDALKTRLRAAGVTEVKEY